MRKILFILCSICLLLSAGCSIGSDSRPEAPIVVHSTHPETTALSEAAASPIPYEKPASFSRGSLEDHVYTNEFADLHIVLDENWRCTESADLEAMTARDHDGTLIQLTDLHAVNDTTGETIVVMYENLARSEGTAAVTEAEYAKVVADGLRSSDEFRFTVHKIEKHTLGGQDYYFLRCSMTDYDMELLYLIRRTGDMMTVIQLSGTDPAHLTDLIS